MFFTPRDFRPCREVSEIDTDGCPLVDVDAVSKGSVHHYDSLPLTISVNNLTLTLNKEKV